MESQVDLCGLVERGLISGENDLFHISIFQKILITVELVKLGATIDSVCRFLRWQEFEQIIQYALSQSNYETIMHLRLNLEQKKSEIDIIGVRGEAILCIDCKHWRYSNKKSALEKAATLQIFRANALAKNFKLIETKLGEKLTDGKIIPLIITLTENPSQIISGVPIVPILKFHDFLNEFYGFLKNFYTVRIHL